MRWAFLVYQLKCVFTKAEISFLGKNVMKWARLSTGLLKCFETFYIDFMEPEFKDYTNLLNSNNDFATEL